MVLQSLPRLPSGKLDRHALPASGEAGPAPSGTYTALEA